MYINYKQQIAPSLKKELNLANVHQIPYIRKVVLNIGLGRNASDARYLEVATNTLRKITGQQPITTTAKKSIANFKLREGAKIGLKVTLRGQRMYDFLERLIKITLPRTRDFRGLSTTAFDKKGNYSIGITDQTVFAELSYEETALLHGLQITIEIANADKAASRQMLEQFGFKFAKDVENG
jgi:large subunit ribosomal protein L5